MLEAAALSRMFLMATTSTEKRARASQPASRLPFGYESRHVKALLRYKYLVPILVLFPPYYLHNIRFRVRIVDVGFDLEREHRDTIQ